MPSACAREVSTRNEGSCRPRSTWLRYGLETRASSASWRSDKPASWRWARRNSPSRCEGESVTWTSCRLDTGRRVNEANGRAGWATRPFTLDVRSGGALRLGGRSRDRGAGEGLGELAGEVLLEAHGAGDEGVATVEVGRVRGDLGDERGDLLWGDVVDLRGRLLDEVEDDALTLLDGVEVLLRDGVERGDRGGHEAVLPVACLVLLTLSSALGMSSGRLAKLVLAKITDRAEDSLDSPEAPMRVRSKSRTTSNAIALVDDDAVVGFST